MSHQNTKTDKKLIYLQYLRGISAILVLNFHCRDWLGMDYGRLLFGNGSDGLTFFFCLSGFIISYTVRKKSSSWQDFKSFIYKRFGRIWPLYLLTSLAAYLILKYILHTEVSISRFVISILFIPIGTPVLYVGWSINAEMIYYFVWGAAFFFLSKKNTQLFSYILTALFLLVYIFKLRGEQILLSGIHYYFFVGTILGLHKEKIQEYIKNRNIPLQTVLVILLFVYSFVYFKVIPESRIFYIVFVPFLLTILIGLKNPKQRTFFGKLLETSGDISYSVYLIHPLIIYLITETLFLLGLGEYVKSPIGWLLINLTTLGVSYFSFKLIEVPLYSLITSKKLFTKAS